MSAYRRGYKAEREFMIYMEQYFKCKSVRSAGSHSPVDVICGNGEKVYAVQIKYGRTKQKVDYEELITWAESFKAIPCIATRKPYGQWKIEYLA